MANYNYLKDKYLEIAKENRNGSGTYTAEMIFALRDMAKKDVYPDGRFSDEECNIWSAFR